MWRRRKKPQVTPQKTPTPAETVNPTPTPSPEQIPSPAPTPEPTLDPTATPTPLPTPESTPTPEGWSDEEIAAKISSAVHIANTVADLFPESELLSTVKVDAQTAVADYHHVIETKDYPSMFKPLNGFANVGLHIGQFACRNTYGEVEGRAWVEVKELVLGVSQKYEDLGFLEAGFTQTFKQAFFRVPEACTNTIMLSSNNLKYRKLQEL